MTRAESRMRAVVVVLGAAVWGATLRAGFTFDDQVTILDQAAVTGPFSPRALLLRDYWGFPFGAGPGTYRPIVTASFWLDWHLGGGRPWLFHVVNVLLYAALLLCGEWFLRRLAPAMSAIARLFAVAAFATLAIHVDVVPSITGRSEILAAIFALAACGFALGERRRDMILSLAMYLLALLSKESTLPIAAFLVWLAIRGRVPRATAAIAVVIAVGFVGFRRALHLPLALVGENFHFANPLHVASTGLRLHGAVQALGHYFEHVFAPVDLCPDYGYAALVPEAQVTRATVVGAVVAVALGGSLALRKRAPIAIDAAAGFVAAYVVSSNLFSTASVFVADRVFFLPSFFVVALIAIAIDATYRKRAAVLVAAGTILVQASFAVAGSTVWRSDEQLWAWTVRACPKGFLGRLNHARSTPNPDDAAWSLLIAVEIFRAFPAPIPDARIPGEWEDEPLARRLDLYRRSRTPAERQSNCAAAARLAASKGLDVAPLAPLCR